MWVFYIYTYINILSVHIFCPLFYQVFLSPSLILSFMSVYFVFVMQKFKNIFLSVVKRYQSFLLLLLYFESYYMVRV